MNIHSLNATNPVKKSKPSFSGQVLTKDVYGNPIYKFNAPNAPEGTKLELAVMTLDKDGNYSIHQGSEKTIPMKSGFESTIVYADDLNLSKDALLGYRIIYPHAIPLSERNEFKDNSMKGDQGYTIAIPLSKANPSRPKVMEHIFIDSFNVKNQKSLHTKRNHFNVLGGTINSVNEKIPELSKAGFTDILGNPIIGQDNKSSQGYWTTNPYQITNNLGNIKDFKNLLTNMFAHDMKWTIDGAFVNEGIEGIHIKDMMNWQYDSPFVHFFETKDLDNLSPRFGVLSKNPEVNKHTHIQIVNGPYKIVFEKDGDRYKEKEIKRNSVDPTRPTYIQMFDDRLASERQMSGEFIFDVYDNKDTGDNHEISNYRDSVQAYHARVTPREVEDNYRKYKEAKHYQKDVEFKNSLTRWKGFELVESNKDSGISLWVGNSDISKKRFIMPESSMYYQNLPENLKPVVKAAQYQVQDDTVQVGKFWTQEVEKTLTEYIAKEIGDKIADKMNYKQAIEALVKEKKLPESAKLILEEEDGVSSLDNILTEDIFGTGRNYKLKEVKRPENITDGMMSYPLEAIEFSPDLVSVFAYPYIKNLAVTEDTIGLSRYDMYKMGDEYYDQVPEKYRETYKKMDSLLANEYSNFAVTILENLEEKLDRKLLDENKNLTTEGEEIYSLIASDIVKFLTVSALAPKIEPQYDDNMLYYDTKELQKIDLNSLNLQYETTPETTALRLMEKIESGLESLSENKNKIDLFTNSLAERLEHVNSDTYNVAKLIIEKTEIGLNWRIDASKDIGDPDSENDGIFTREENIDAVNKFWNKFNTGVNEYNPSAFKIGELTDWGSGVISSFLNKTKFDATSEYEFLYSTLPRLFGATDEGTHLDNFAKEIDEKLFTKQNSLGFFDTGTLDYINFAHKFAGNHDKPRILHLFATEPGNLYQKHKITDRAGEMAKTIADRGMKKSYEFNQLSENLQKAMFQANYNLKHGTYHKDGQEKSFDPEKYGSRPFDFNIDDVINEAIEIDKDFKNFATNPANRDQINRLKSNILYEILKPALAKYKAMWFVMNALPGTPTNYAGDELGMTGWEYFAKNEEQENRNALRWDRLTNPNCTFLKEYKEQMDAITQIRKKEAASALVNGTTLKLKDQPIPDNGPALTLYRYNDKTDAICVLHNTGFGGDPDNYPRGEVFINRIDLGGLPDGLKEGTIYVDVMNPKDKYKVTNPYEIKKVNNNDTNKIEESINIHNSGLILVREEGFNGKKMSFKGQIENPNVKLANTKYNFSYMQK